MRRRPVLTYLALCYAITWGVLFALPFIVGRDWSSLKVAVGSAMGPGLAAILLDRTRGGRRIWPLFLLISTIVFALLLSILITGDASRAAELRRVVPPGLTPIGIGSAIAAALVCGTIFASAARSGNEILRSVTRWRAPLRWWAVALFLPAALLGAGWLAERAFGEVPGDPLMGGLPFNTWWWYTARSVLFTFLVVGIGEEVGWRGWMLPELQKRFSPLTSSILLGLVWGFWHLPLFIIGVYPGGPESIVEYLFIGPLLAILFTWMFNRTGGNLLLAMALHAAVNNSPRFIPGSAVFPVLLIGFIIAVVVRDRMWVRRVQAPMSQ
jgi:uncharacterized protein